MSGVDVLGGPGGQVGFGGEGVEWEAGLTASLLATALLEPSVAVDLVAEATRVFQEGVLFRVAGYIDPEAAKLIEGPVVDVLELVDCVGADVVGDAINWAYGVLTGEASAPQPEGFEVLADCLGWARDPGELPPSLAASLLIASLTASFNKYLAGVAAGEAD